MVEGILTDSIDQVTIVMIALESNKSAGICTGIPHSSLLIPNFTFRSRSAWGARR